MSGTEPQPIGAPVWFELSTTDQTAAVQFYCALFGWSAAHHAIDEGGAYTIFEKDGCEVAACFSMPEEQRAHGAPVRWAVYFRVADCDAATAAAQAAGASLLAAPFEVMNHLRMSVLADPEGATFCLSQQREHPGVGMIHEVDTIGWVELATRNVELAGAFYQPLLGWSLAEHPSAPPTPYRIFSVDGENQGGLLQMNEQWGDAPAHWSIYLRVADVDATVAKAQSLGGSVCVPAFDAPGVGRIAMIGDPTGGFAYLIALAGNRPS